MAEVSSHGRGGAGNLEVDNTKYADGEIVRVGPEGSRGDGAYSSGRGGGGNITDSGAPELKRTDKDLIPEAAVRGSIDGDHHVGRGGAGNEHIAAKEPVDPKAIDHDKKVFEAYRDTHPDAPVKGLADKLKDFLLRRK